MRNAIEKVFLCIENKSFKKTKICSRGRMSSANRYSIFNGIEQSVTRMVSLDEYLS